ncbi:acyl-CoA carboxylase subunit epsilon [Nocardioides sp.]|uniref:acyl-CoA carboxylase subunit epsilon n=1 Tax=Nocardioides sp. TaxID=35761 RepID=UPI002734CAC0|nr:acyl-CoA carboxylase subunit epsilon [Nocardioides sp.]MDP3892285.1 acyl-CoA carboxylase subunit epsilon [Nocardioides sp.]
MSDPNDTGRSTEAPFLRVVNPDATPEEIAALVAVLITPQTPATPTPGNPSEWPVSNRLRSPLHPGPGRWRASSLPR